MATKFEEIILKIEEDKANAAEKKRVKDEKQFVSETKSLNDIAIKIEKAEKESKGVMTQLQMDNLKFLESQKKGIEQDRMDRDQEKETASKVNKTKLDLDKEALSKLKQGYTDQNIKAESVQEYNRESLRIQNEELDIQIENADNRKARRELQTEKKKLNDDAKKSGSLKEDVKERTKSLAEAFSKSTIGKGILSIGKSIGGFIGGLASTATGGAMMFLKGIIGASVLGLIITFLKSDMFKEFLSEENLKKLTDFFIDLKGYFKTAFDFIADPDNTSSIAYALGIAAFAKMGGLSLIGGTLMALGGLFSLGGIFGKTAITNANASIAKTKKGGGLGKFTKFLKAGALIGLGIAAFDGIKAAQDSYMKGNPFGKIVADSVGGIVESLTFGIVDAAAISRFFSPSDNDKILKKQKAIDELKKSEVAGAPAEVKRLEAELEVFKTGAKQRAIEKKKNQEQRGSQAEFDKRKADFVRDSVAIELKKNKNFDELSGSIAFIKQFDDEFGQQNPQLKLDAIEKKKEMKEDALDLVKRSQRDLKSNNKILEALKKRDPENLKEIAVFQQKSDKLQTVITNNIVNSSQTDNSKIQTSTIFSKDTTNITIAEQYLNSG